ncbi:AAA family ATPase [Bdellovibrio sp. HCB-110]|uniref:ATP-binding protein n=1 Tax=Bdellovibrio sp. HCB-110 TaxID=3391182 RepID=UPI0039B651F0
MSRFRIGRIGIKNFKIFPEYKEIRLDGSDLVVFDGPNGFGKTSVFDSIEFGLTGKIKRLDLYDESVKNTKLSHGYPFVNSIDGEFFIKIEFTASNSSLVICRYLDATSVKAKGKGKINWSGVGLRRLEKWDDSYDSGAVLTQKDLEGLFGAPDLERVFNVFFYVQQEENTFFLKRSENERKEYLNVLFDVDRESKYVEQLKEISKVHKEYIQEKDKQILDLKATIVVPKVEDAPLGDIKHEILFPKGTFEWDKESPDFAKMSMDTIQTGIKGLRDLVEHRDVFKRQKMANDTRSFFVTPDFVSSFILQEVFSSRFAEIEELIRRGSDLKSFYEGLKSKRYLDMHFWEKYRIYMGLFPHLDTDAIIKDIIEFQKAEKGHNALEKSRNELIRLRESLLSRFQEYLSNQSDSKDGECPLCGQDWGDFQTLIGAISKEEQRFVNQNQGILQGYLKTIDDFAKKVESSLQKNLGETYFPQENLLLKIRASARSVSIYQKFKDYLLENGISYDFSGELIELADLSKLDIVAKDFQGRVLEFLDKEKSLTDEAFATWDSYFVRYFQSDFENFKNINGDLLDSKLRYLKVKFGEYLTVKNEVVKYKIQKIIDEKEQVRKRVEQVKALQDLHEDEIRKHISRIINDISIPFYVNSGRILQEFHGGNGIFVRMGSKKTEGVKFFTDIDTENDPLYSLSSGQISSLVLAFCLTLNDVYKHHYLGMVLIDDPVQTMDEINTITFIDLIRTSFKDRQFLISTHEDNFSSLIRYKFKQVDSTVSVIKMRDVV